MKIREFYFQQNQNFIFCWFLVTAPICRSSITLPAHQAKSYCKPNSLITNLFNYSSLQSLYFNLFNIFSTLRRAHWIPNEMETNTNPSNEKKPSHSLEFTFGGSLNIWSREMNSRLGSNSMNWLKESSLMAWHLTRVRSTRRLHLEWSGDTRESLPEGFPPHSLFITPFSSSGSPSCSQHHRGPKASIIYCTY